MIWFPASGLCRLNRFGTLEEGLSNIDLHKGSIQGVTTVCVLMLKLTDSNIIDLSASHEKLLEIWMVISHEAQIEQTNCECCLKAVLRLPLIGSAT